MSDTPYAAGQRDWIVAGGGTHRLTPADHPEMPLIGLAAYRSHGHAAHRAPVADEGAVARLAPDWNALVMVSADQLANST